MRCRRRPARSSRCSSTNIGRPKSEVRATGAAPRLDQATLGPSRPHGPRYNMADLLVVGSVALDSVETPFGKVREVLGGSATYFSYSASFFTQVRLVATVGEDFPEEHLRLLKDRGVDLAGLQVARGRTFRWTGQYGYDLNEARTLDTQLNVFADFRPAVTADLRGVPFLFLANIDPEIQLDVLRQMR